MVAFTNFKAHIYIGSGTPTLKPTFALVVEHLIINTLKKARYYVLLNYILADFLKEFNSNI